ncbi:SDR family oxidoreductase [Kineococcus sp. T13]|uniref:SDR family NAD(P)-dependent oxidoreductase n=1 Tax=Kineococcus vitellinus TaxID=2696565 RepID=UPI001412AB5D|nr:SDR family oxidoreductase [Kineococcus vitellinus]NAZ75428.1 SDR family oxidoreductase [Kineococcus vitellinus]
MPTAPTPASGTASDTESGTASVTLVTGASSGIGQGAALEVARQGAGVVLTYRGNPDGAEETVQRIEEFGGTAVALPLDTARTETFPAFAEEVSRALQETWGSRALTGLVNNAGSARPAAFADTTEAVVDELGDVLFKGPFFLTRALLPLLADGASIVNVGSSSTRPFGMTPGFSAYAAFKGAVVVWSRYLAKELGGRGIRVNTVAPGPTRTRLGGDAFARHPELIAPLAANTALGRIGEGADVGRVIAFLLSEQAGWITGQDIDVSGGYDL